MKADGATPGRPRVVFDPDLPPRILRRLRNGSGKLLPKSRPPDSAVTRRQTTGYVVSAAMVLGSWGCAHLAPMAPNLTEFAVRVLSTLGLVALVVWGARQGGRVGAVLALLLIWGPLFLVWGVAQGTALASGSAFFWTAGPVAALALAIKTTSPIEVRQHGRYLMPEDFEPSDAEALDRLQEAMNLIRRAALTLGSNIGPGWEERWLGEQEWSIASSLAKCSELGRDLRNRSHNAVTARVSHALQPQHDVLTAARESVNERIRSFEKYAQRAATAATTHEELCQIEENERRDDAFLGLLTSTASETASTKLGDSGVQALQEALEEQLTRTIDAGRWLVELVESRTPDEDVQALERDGAMAPTDEDTHGPGRMDGRRAP